MSTFEEHIESFWRTHGARVEFSGENEQIVRRVNHMLDMFAHANAPDAIRERTVPAHRRYLHTREFIDDYITVVYGEIGRLAAERHVLDDCGHIPRATAFWSGAVDPFGARISRDHPLPIDVQMSEAEFAALAGQPGVGELIAGDDELLEGVKPGEPEATEPLIKRLQGTEGLDLADPAVMERAWRNPDEVEVPELSAEDQAFRERVIELMARDIPAMADAAARLVLAASELRHAERMLDGGGRNTKFERPLLIDRTRARRELDQALEAINAAMPEARKKR